jgi:cytochrome c oxidase assembly factor CtaG
MRTLAGLAPVAGAIVIYLAVRAFGAVSPWTATDPWIVGPICTVAVRRTRDFTLDLWITGPLFGSGLLYLGGVAVLWSRVGIGRGVQPWQAVAFGAGWLALASALVSPLHHAGEQLFTAHMIEHELVMAVAAPLLVLARPAAAFLWALPRSLRHGIGHATRAGVARMAWRALTRPLNATLLHGVAIWAWHVPALFDAAVVNVPLHRLQHVSFLATGLLFWWAMLRRSGHGAASGHLFFTMIHTGLLGALLTLAPRVLYLVQTAHAPDWGLSPLEDQQLAGLVMWIPAGTIYAGAALAFAALWIRRSGKAETWRDDYALRRP